jgi:hypothetical protein
MSARLTRTVESGYVYGSLAELLVDGIAKFFGAQLAINEALNDCLGIRRRLQSLKPH